MDLVAARVCYKHLKVIEPHDYFVVTGSIHTFVIHSNDYSLQETLVMDAYLVFVGSRSMEVQIELNNEIG